MRTIAFVGPSGTGKSYLSTKVSSQNGADAIIDDGILISQGRLLAGSSAKKEPTRLASVRHALFTNDTHADEVKKAVKNNNIKCVMILGTSDAMVNKIADRLEIAPVEKIIRIEEVSTPEAMKMAKEMRIHQGKHVIPVPTFEIKQDFSGYFLHPLRLFRKGFDNKNDILEADKSIVRPTFSYMGDYTISDNVLVAMAKYEGNKINGVKITDVRIRKTIHGLHMDLIVIIDYGADIYKTCKNIQQVVKESIEKYTSLNARRVHVLVKSLRIPQ